MRYIYPNFRNSISGLKIIPSDFGKLKAQISKLSKNMIDSSYYLRFEN